MPGTIRTSAPGKLFLIGEYAVLDGAPALLTSVNRRAHVTITPAHDQQWRLTAANLDIHGLALAPSGATPAEADADLRHKLSVFDAVRRAVVARLAGELPPLHIEIDTRDFARDGHKLGLGSSAAVAAALTYALGLAGGQGWAPAELCALAIAAHRDAQHGTGSGGDVATSVYGGLISYRRDQTPQPLAWPADLLGMAVVTGEGASTTELVGRVKALAERDRPAYNAGIATLSRLADTAQQSLADNRLFLDLADAYFDALGALDTHAGAGIISTRHHALHALAAEHGAVFKSSGAGGGDVGLLFVTRGAQETAVRRAFAESDAHILPLILGGDGTRIEHVP